MAKECADLVEEAIGIDLGTTFSVLAHWNEKTESVDVLKDDEGNDTIPSVITFLPDGTRLFGHAAVRAAGEYPERTVYESKRLIGLMFDSPSIAADIASWPFKVVRSDDGVPLICPTPELRLTAADIACELLTHFRDVATRRLGRKVGSAVVCCPAYFNDGQRAATQEAARRAGLAVLRMVNEPTAAAVSFGLDAVAASAPGTSTPAKNVVVFDLGGGTFDVTLMKIRNAKYIDVLGSGGDTHLGGADFDAAIVDLVLATRPAGSPAPSAGAKALLRLAAEAAKRRLSECDATAVTLRDAVAAINKAGGVVEAAAVADLAAAGLADFDVAVTRAQFEEKCAPLFAKAVAAVRKTVDDAKDAKVTLGSIADVVLVGGSTRIPRVRAAVAELFGGRRLNDTLNADLAVAQGAAIQAALLTRMAKSAGVPPVNMPIDATPLTLALEAQDGTLFRMVPKGTQLPYDVSRDFVASVDGAATFHLRVHESESGLASPDTLIGVLDAPNIPAPRHGRVKLAVRFIVDRDGILTVEASAEGIDKVSAKLTKRAGMLDALRRDARVLRDSDLESRAMRLKAARDLLSSRCGDVASAAADPPDPLPADHPAVATARAADEWLRAKANAVQADFGRITAQARQVREFLLALTAAMDGCAKLRPLADAFAAADAE